MITINRNTHKNLNFKVNAFFALRISKVSHSQNNIPKYLWRQEFIILPNMGNFVWEKPLVMFETFTLPSMALRKAHIFVKVVFPFFPSDLSVFYKTFSSYYLLLGCSQLRTSHFEDIWIGLKLKVKTFIWPHIFRLANRAPALPGKNLMSSGHFTLHKVFCPETHLGFGVWGTPGSGVWVGRVMLVLRTFPVWVGRSVQN